MSEKKRIQEFRLKNKNETRNYFGEEIDENKLLSKEHKKVCRVLNFIEHSLILIFTVTFYSFWYSYWNSEFCSICSNNCRN